MILHRLAAEPYTGIDGTGGLHVSGRWHNRGHPILYTAAHLSLALLEQLVRRARDPEVLRQAALVALRVEVPDDATVERVAALPHDIAASRNIGDEWLAARRTLLLTVPSVIVPSEDNVLLNPRHERYTEVRLGDREAFTVDARLMA